MKTLPSAPFTRDESDVAYIMNQVLLALTPATVFGLLLFGLPAIYLFVVTVVSAVAWEALCLSAAGRPVRPALRDRSAVLTGWLLAMSLPPWAPWWIGVVGGFLAIVVGKHVYGGLGQNLFNPAMLARVALLVSFPVEMTRFVDPLVWSDLAAPGPVDAWRMIFGGVSIPDGYTGATLIGNLKTEFSQGRGVQEAYQSGGYTLLGSMTGFIRGSLGETSAIALAAGGLWLIRRRIITWHIPASLLLTVALLATAFSLVDPDRYPGPLFHLGSGAMMLLSFFIATDYVTSPNTAAGRVLFGCGCGVTVFVIRTWGAYPEGAGFAVLLMNALTPVIDHYIRPRIYGRDRKRRPLELEGRG